MTGPALDPTAIARDILEVNHYLTLGTADAQGEPWVSPVYYAMAGFRRFYWVSSPDAQHSRNIAGRPGVSLVVFDSHAAINTGQAVYMRAEARRLDGAELAEGLRVFSARSQAQGERAWNLADVQPPSGLHLYVAIVSQHWILDPHRRPDQRMAVHPDR